MKDLIKKEVLRSLILSRRWGAKHTEIKNLEKGISTYLLDTKSGKKAFQKAIKELIKDNLLLTKKSTGEIHASLNPRKKQEIMNLVESS
ncbi:MAG: hypothetical protein ABIB47_04830 [Candidatus Woesearchaeota archaeon]